MENKNSDMLKGGFTMKKISALFLMMFLVTSAFNFVSADESNESSYLENGAIEPHKVGFFENAFDGFRFAFAFNKEKKIEIALERAEKRMAMAEEMFAEDNPERYAELQEEYDAFVAKAEGVLEEIKEAKANNENDSIENMERMARIQNKFEKHRDHVDEMYARVLERFELNNASDDKIERFEMFHERALNHSYEVENKILEKRENAIRRHKVLSEMSDEELENLLESVEEGLTQAREKRAEKAENRIEKVSKIRAREEERIQERLNESDLTDAQRERLMNRLEQGQERANRFEEGIENRIAVPGMAGKRAENLRNSIERELERRGSGSEDAPEDEPESENESEIEEVEDLEEDSNETSE